MSKELFLEHRTHRAFRDEPVDEAILHELYDLAKMGPTASNLNPMRISFVTSDEAKAKVIDAVAEGNKAKTQSAPVVAIIAHDLDFANHIPTLAPHMNQQAYQSQDASKLAEAATENTWLSAGYLILAARTLGLDCGPMSGFNKDKINDAFFAGTSLRADMLLNLGYGDATALYERGARLSFDEACQIL